VERQTKGRKGWTRARSSPCDNIFRASSHVKDIKQSHMNKSCHAYVDESCDISRNESCHIYMDESCHIHIDESCDMPHVTSYVTYTPSTAKGSCSPEKKAVSKSSACPGFCAVMSACVTNCCMSYELIVRVTNFLQVTNYAQIGSAIRVRALHFRSDQRLLMNCKFINKYNSSTNTCQW